MTPPPSEPTALADLLRRAGAGDAAALEELLRRYEKRVRLAARSLLRPPMRHALDSLDLVQSVHRALLPGLRDGRYTCATEDQLVGLAVTVLRHKVLRAARRAGPAPLDAGDVADPTPPGGEADAADLLARVLRHLEPDDRRIVEMRLKGCDTAEIAAAAGSTSAVVRARLSRLRKRLREAGVIDPFE